MTSANHAPTAVNEHDLRVRRVEHCHTGQLAALANDSDPDGPNLAFSAIVSSNGGSSHVFASNPTYDASAGTITFDTTGFTSNNNTIRDGTITYQITDNASPALTATATVTVHVVDLGHSSNDNYSVPSGSYQGAYLDGGAGNDNLSGGSGPDIFVGGNGDDNFSGGGGTDTFLFTSANFTSGDHVDGNAGTDTIQITDAATVVDSDFTLVSNIEILKLGDFTNSVTLGTLAADAMGDHTLTVDDSAASSSHPLNLDASGFNNGSHHPSVNVIGGAGNDIIVGSPNNDTINGGAGNDTLTGGGGNDTIDGGAGSSDTAVYSGARSDYTVTFDDATLTYTIIDKRAGSPDGTDTVTNVENYQFSNGTFTNIVNVATVTVVTPNGYDLHGLYGDMAGANLTNPSTTSFDAVNAATGHTFHVVGTGLAYTGSNLTGGTVTEIDILDTATGATLVTETGFAIDGGALGSAVQAFPGTPNHPGQLNAIFDQYSYVAHGGAGNDTLLSYANADSFDGGGGLNTVDYVHYASGITADLANPSLNTGNAAGDTYTNINSLIGTNFNDTLIGDGNTNALEGGAGADTLIGGGGSRLRFVQPMPVLA